MRHDLIKLARYMWDCHTKGRPFRLPAMKFSELGRFLSICKDLTPS